MSEAKDLFEGLPYNDLFLRDQIEGLTPRQLQVLECVMKGGIETGVIAERLSIAQSTVRTHLEVIYETLGVSGKTEAMIVIFRMGLVTKQDGSSNINIL